MSDLLKETFERMADRAGPVPGLAEEAMRRASRRRAARLTTAVTLAAAVAVSVPFVLSGGEGQVVPEPSGAGRLPVNSSAEQQVVRACLGGPSGYRLLVSVRRGAETVAMVGGERGFLLCSGAEGRSQVFRPWPNPNGKGLRSFNGEASIDGIGSLTRVDHDGRATGGLHHVITGRVKPGVRKVLVTWNRNRTVEATIRNGFFIAAIDGEPSKDRVMKVETVGPQGLPSLYWTAGRTGGAGEFNFADCDEPREAPIESLCQGLPDRP